MLCKLLSACKFYLFFFFGGMGPAGGKGHSERQIKMFICTQVS